MRVHNYFASCKSRVTNERNFSATPISFSFSSFFCLFASSLSQCGYSTSRMHHRQKRNRKVEGSEQKTPPPTIFTYTYAQYARIQHCTRIRSRARDTSTCENKTATLLASIIFADQYVIRDM